MRSSYAVVALGLVASLAGCSGSGGSATTPTPATTPATAVSIGNSKLVTPGTLTIGSDIPYAPQEFYDSANNPAGFDVEIGQAVAAKMGLQTAFVNQDFDHIIPSLTARKFDVVISAMTITDDRKQQVLFVPYFKAGTTLLVQTASGFRPSGLADLCGHHAGAQSSTVEADELHAQAQLCPAASPMTVSEFTTDPEGVEQLKQGKVDVEFTDSPPGEYAVKQSSGALTISGPILNVAPEGIAIANGNPDLQAAVQKAFDAIVADGTYAKLLNKWGLSGGAIRP